MAIRKIYVGDRDKPLWAAAQRVADRRNTSVSRLVTEALSQYLPQVVAQPDPAERWDAIAADAA